MNLSLNIILDQLRSLPLEVHIDDPAEKIFCRGALLPRDYRVMRKDLLHVCRLSDATACFRRCARIVFISVSGIALPMGRKRMSACRG